MAAAVQAGLLIVVMLEPERAAGAASGDIREIYVLCPRARSPSVSRPNGKGRGNEGIPVIDGVKAGPRPRRASKPPATAARRG
jgi:hypothetical protein